MTYVLTSGNAVPPTSGSAGIRRIIHIRHLKTRILFSEELDRPRKSAAHQCFILYICSSQLLVRVALAVSFHFGRSDGRSTLKAGRMDRSRSYDTLIAPCDNAYSSWVYTLRQQRVWEYAISLLKSQNFWKVINRFVLCAFAFQFCVPCGCSTLGSNLLFTFCVSM